ncbi:uncharacterized protein TNCV_3612891 [Trichonephila clavipes]|uniref:DUF5641 domain-containing protein n=1 Tax=Trichonephila clavipes TaxID=2585209 RepID=A0A8X6SML5_TRICX|nr:uncharacterized protein TNCV_3612891 [Trichonephila clavipes]
MLESKEILSLAKFNLRGWVHTGVSEAEKGTLLEEEKKVPVLGLIWKPDKDTLSVNWEENSKINEIPVTKRKILSAVHRIFDPIGTEVGGAITCQLVQARARVASIKPITIPRLELLACTIGSRLINTTKIDLGLENVPIYCWSDSVNALYWIKRKENWGTFVNNRVQEIRRLTNPEDWKLIPGRDGRVRVVEVSTSSGSFLRPIQRLYTLEVSGTDISDLPEQIKETLKDRV